MTNKDKYLSKIKKLLNLARKNTNANESAAAIRQAQNLMHEHNLTETDVDLMEINEASSKGAPSNAGSIPQYMGYLGEVICLTFGVKCYYAWRYTSYRGVPRRCVVFYGPAERPQIAAYAFDVLSRQMMTARREFLGSMRKSIKTSTKVARCDTFCENWVQGAYQVLDDYAVTEVEATLIMAYQQRLRTQSGVATGELREAKRCRGADDAAYAGYQSGKNATLNRALSGSTGSSLLLEGKQ